MDKSRDAFRTISEVADWLGTPTHVLRFWESRFTQVKPIKRAGGRRYYRPADMELLGGIKQLLHDDGMTIRGVQKLLREEGVRHVSALSQPVDDDLAEDGAEAGGVEEAPMALDVPQMAEPIVDNVVPLTPPSAAPVEPVTPIAPAAPVAPVQEPLPVQGDLLEESGLTPSQNTGIDAPIPEATTSPEPPAPGSTPEFALEQPIPPVEPIAPDNAPTAQNAEPSFGDHTPDFIQPDAPLDGADAPALSAPDTETAPEDEAPVEWMAPEPLLPEPLLEEAPLLEGAPLEAPENGPIEEPVAENIQAAPTKTESADIWRSESDLAQTSDFEDGPALEDATLAADTPDEDAASGAQSPDEDAALSEPSTDPAPLTEPAAEAGNAAEPVPIAEPAPDSIQAAQTSDITADIPDDPSDEDDLPDAEFAALNALRGAKPARADQEALGAIYARLATLRARM